MVYGNVVHDDVPCPKRVEQLVHRVLSGEQVLWAQVSIILTNHDTVTELNRMWLQHAYNTDVLSFVIEELDQGLEGEVYVDTETADERHQEFGATYEEEVLRYVVHGLLHLAGHDDQTAEGQRLMRQLEDHYLKI